MTPTPGDCVLCEMGEGSGSVWTSSDVGRPLSGMVGCLACATGF